ncbi:MAG: T9SS type A sorting domain-containing protein, partial [Rhodothermales bacterium]
QGPLVQGDSIPRFNPARPEIGSNSVFRAYRYAADYPGLQGKDLTSMGPIEVATESESDLPTDFVLFQNFPNPFNPTTAISFNLSRTSQVTLTIYNGVGQRVATLADRRYGTGTYVLHFDATGLPSGVYFYRLETDGGTTTRAMMLLK